MRAQVGAEDLRPAAQTVCFDVVARELCCIRLQLDADGGRLLQRAQQQHRQHARAVVVHHAERAEGKAQHNDRRTGQDIKPALSLRPRRLHQADAEQAEKQRPDHVLMYGIEHRSSVHQVERHLGEHGKEQHPQRIALEAARVEIALHRQKGEDRKGQPPDVRQPHLRGKQHRP